MGVEAQHSGGRVTGAEALVLMLMLMLMLIDTDESVLHRGRTLDSG